jgi:integrase
VALSRYGGLRRPSEHLELTWPDVDWQKGRFRVTSPKTEHHEGNEERWVPIFPELRPYLEEAFERAEPGSVKVITCKQNAKQNLRSLFAKIIRRAGLTPWPKPFQNLRTSPETELAAAYPLHVVTAWLGNSALVAQKHYLQVTEADFQRRAKAVQNPVQQPAASSRTVSQTEPEPIGVAGLCKTVQADTEICGRAEYAWRDSNPQPMAP